MREWPGCCQHLTVPRHEPPGALTERNHRPQTQVRMHLLTQGDAGGQAVRLQERKRREEEAAKLAAANKAKADAAAAVSVAMQSVIAFVVGLRTGVTHLSVWIYLSICLSSVCCWFQSGPFFSLICLPTPLALVLCAHSSLTRGLLGCYLFCCWCSMRLGEHHQSHLCGACLVPALQQWSRLLLPLLLAKRHR